MLRSGRTCVPSLCAVGQRKTLSRSLFSGEKDVSSRQFSFFASVTTRDISEMSAKKATRSLVPLHDFSANSRKKHLALKLLPPTRVLSLSSMKVCSRKRTGKELSKKVHTLRCNTYHSPRSGILVIFCPTVKNICENEVSERRGGG